MSLHNCCVSARPIHRDLASHRGWPDQLAWICRAIFEEAVSAGLLERAPRVVPITTADYPTPARRPAYSRLSIDTLQGDFGIELPEWRVGLQRVIAELSATKK